MTSPLTWLRWGLVTMRTLVVDADAGWRVMLRDSASQLAALRIGGMDLAPGPPGA
jgi:hypothetical protein